MDKKTREKMIGKIYGLLKEKEKNRNWESFLDSILIELLSEPNKDELYYILYSKLSMCRYLTYKYYRKIILECLNLLSKENVHE